eukprot:425365_1
MHLDTILWIFPLRNIGHFNKEVIALFDLFWMEICMYFVWSLVQELKRISGRTQQRATPLKHNMHLDINFWIILGWQQTRLRWLLNMWWLRIIEIHTGTSDLRSWQQTDSPQH